MKDDERGDPDTVLGSMAAWKQAYDDAQNGRPLTFPLPMSASATAPPATTGPGWPISQVRPLDLEVHPAIRVDTSDRGLGELPAYIPRAHDEILADIVRQVQAGTAEQRLHRDVRDRLEDHRLAAGEQRHLGDQPHDAVLVGRHERGIQATSRRLSR
ncbi:hypothetical protein GCM10009530_21950 [Microbispora corallina]|uniref:hypothetical protein n=1 Tax=Microbispora corallina TaxID=83302 RepID=UPI00194F23FC|nr:hypothetical protein [Microbispora corallina]